MISPEAAKVYEIFRNMPKQVDMDLHHQREAGEHAEDMTSEPEGVECEAVSELGGFWATPANWDGDSALVYLFGGGYVISSPHSRRKLAGHLANASGARFLVPKYRLAPEQPFPAAVEDAAAAFRWLLDRDFRPERVLVGGDSSGGGLTAATLLKLRNDGGPVPGGGVMISPWVDLACTGKSLDTRRRRPHRYQVQPRAHGRPVPRRGGSPHPARLPALWRPLWASAPADDRRE